MCSENFYFHNRYSEYTNETTDFTSCDRKVDDLRYMRCYQAVIKIFNQCSVCVCALGGQGDYFWGWDIFFEDREIFWGRKEFY